MRNKIFLLALLLNAIPIVDSITQNLPLVYTVENTGAGYPKPPLPAFDLLPEIPSLPDPFLWADGRGRISSINDWPGRRAQIKAQIENYEIGEKPVRPDTITASYSGGILTVVITKNKNTLTLTSQVTLPSGNGPFPAVIGALQSVPSTVFSSRNIAQITFNYNQVTTDGNASNSNPYYKLYPHLNIDNTGQYSAWAWGVSRIIDGLELVQNVLPIDLKHIAVSGCSRGGKIALYAGAYDERIALTIAQESGGGGATSWRYSQSEPPNSVEKIDNTDYNWFMNSMRQFSGNNVSRLPEDHHELMAMCAPRALLVTANPDMIWLSNPSCYVSSKACQLVYEALGISDRFGFSIIGGHGHCAVPSSQIPEIEAFVDKFLLGNSSVNTNINTTPYTTDLSPWITWTKPTLSNASAFGGWTSLIYPANLQHGLDKTITLKWKKVNNASKYIIQLAADPLFTNIVQYDSTTIDTVKTITGLLDGKRYYWRVQVKNPEGNSGPWSDPWNFTTFISLPAKPQLVGVIPYSNRSDARTLKWKRVKDADQYLIQIADVNTFSYGIASASTSDTVKTFTGLNEGIRYYWRVQANNVSGSSPWSDVSNFATILPPTNLSLRRSALNEITLAWDDNSTIENGYVIERKQSSQTSFTVLDSLKGSGNEYVDKKAEQALAYSYRTKAYTQSAESEYSNEASISGVVGVKEEEVPAEYSMGQNYPNPFNPETTINFSIPKSSFVTLVVYNLLGEKIRTLINEEKGVGIYNIKFTAGSLAGGIYFYRLHTQNFTETKKLILIK